MRNLSIHYTYALFSEAWPFWDWTSNWSYFASFSHNSCPIWF